MVKKNNPIILVFAALMLGGFFTVHTAEIKLELDEPATTVGLNQPFGIKVIIKDARNPGNIALQGLDTVQVLEQGQSSSTNIVNGVSTSQTNYHITVQARREGPLKLGPAQIVVDGQTIASNTISLDVSKNHAPQGPSKAGQPSVMCKLSADKKNVVVGEPIALTLSIYRTGQILEMALNTVSFDRFLVKEIKERTEHDEVVDGIQYRVQKLHYTLIPLQEGVRELKPVEIHYLAPQGRSSRHGHFDFGGAIEAFFGQQSERKIATSNDLKITVSPLPEHKGQVHGIGDFRAFTASISKQDADINEPVTLTLSIEGSGNFEQIAIPALTLPKWFKAYESKTEIQNSKDGSKKTFDFVVQATKPGNVTIPPQTFSYFDVTTRSYKTLKTSPINLEITVPDDYQEAPTPTKAPKQQSPEQTSTGGLDRPATASTLAASNNIALPWWLFLLLLLAPLFLFKKKLVNFANRIGRKFFGKCIHRRNLARFEKKLDVMVKSGDAHALHQFFLKFLAAKNDTNINVVTEDWIEHRLKEAGWTPGKIDEFLEFLSTSARLQFMLPHASSIDQNALLKKSQYWLIMLNK